MKSILEQLKELRTRIDWQLIGYIIVYAVLILLTLTAVALSVITVLKDGG